MLRDDGNGQNQSADQATSPVSTYGPVGVYGKDVLFGPRYHMFNQLEHRAVEGLIGYLMLLRRIRFYLMIIVSTLVGLVFFPFHVNFAMVYKLIMGLSLTGSVAFFVGAVSTLAIRHLFLKEAAMQGCSQTTAILMMLFAERRARTLLFVLSREERMEHMIRAVREAQDMYTRT